jgi:hypothetical protein
MAVPMIDVDCVRGLSHTISQFFDTTHILALSYIEALKCTTSNLSVFIN